MADRHSLEEFKLRYVIALPAEYHTEIIRQIIDFNLTSRQVKALCESGVSDTETANPLEKLPASAVKMARISHAVQTTTAQDLAHALVQQEGDANMARVRLQAFQKLLSDAEQYLTTD